jgi:signal transduction histidine kinase
VLNTELAEKTEELAAQSEELTKSNQLITSLNLKLEEKVRSRTKELEQAYKELDTFFYRSSHDFRRPLTTFMGLAEVAKITVADPNALDLFDKVNITAHALDRMLIKLLSISELTADQQAIKLINIRTYIEEAYAVYSQQILQHNILAEIHPGTYAEFHTCPTYIKNILENLVENSIVFRADRNPRIIVSAKQVGESMLITVEDNGIGMEAEYIHRATEMFFRGSERSHGNGLGLYIVKKSVEKLDGEVTFQSVPRSGTIVTVRIPVS